MSKIISILESMGMLSIKDKKSRLLNSIISIKCCKCHRKIRITADAVYRQNKRGRNKYICKSCSSKAGWTEEKRRKASNRASAQWHDSAYAGTISGKALARKIIEDTPYDIDFPATPN